MTTIKVLKRGSLSLFGKAIKRAETILKDGTVYITANKNFSASQGRNYIGSKDKR